MRSLVLAISILGATAEHSGACPLPPVHFYPSNGYRLPAYPTIVIADTDYARLNVESNERPVDFTLTPIAGAPRLQFMEIKLERGPLTIRLELPSGWIIDSVHYIVDPDYMPSGAIWSIDTLGGSPHSRLEIASEAILYELISADGRIEPSVTGYFRMSGEFRIVGWFTDGSRRTLLRSDALLPRASRWPTALLFALSLLAIGCLLRRTILNPEPSRVVW